MSEDIFDNFKITSRDTKRHVIWQSMDVQDENFDSVINPEIIRLKSLIAEKKESIENYGIHRENDKIEGIKLDLRFEVFMLENYLFTLMEMRIIYFYKSLEIAMKGLLSTSFDNNSVKNYKWDNLKDSFKDNEVEIVSLPGYQESYQLKQVNNNLKHSGSIGAEIKSYSEFSKLNEYDWESIESFYRRVKPKVKDFKEALCAATLQSVFEFDDNKLEKISTYFAERMGPNTIDNLINKLQQKKGK